MQVPLVRSQASVSQQIQEGDNKQLFITNVECSVTFFSNPGDLKQVRTAFPNENSSEMKMYTNATHEVNSAFTKLGAFVLEAVLLFY